MSELWELGIAATARMIARKQISPVEVVDHFLARATTLNSTLHCFTTIEDDPARVAARKAEAEIMEGQYRGPLHGIPYAVKDIIDVSGFPTTNNSRLTLGDVATSDASVVARLGAAGAILLGKTETQEFAMGGPDFSLPFGPARNPWDLDRFTGGSSSGSAAAVAAGTVPLGIGTDTGGSIRTPSAYCGIAGMKPTYGRVSRRGMTPQAYSMETAGPMTWSVEDNAIALQALAGHDPGDPSSVDIPSQPWTEATSLGLCGMRIGLLRSFHEEEPDFFSDECVAVFEEAARLFEDAGATTTDVSLSPLRHYFAAQRVIMYSEAAAVHEDDFRRNLHIYGPYSVERFLPGFLLTATDYLQACRRRGELTTELAEAFSSVDLLLVIGALGVAPLIRDVARNSLVNGTLSVNAAFNLTGSPAMSVPAGISANGLPLSVQIVGPNFDEFSIYRAARVIEDEMGRRAIRPQAIHKVGSPTWEMRASL
ncbi:amidase [Agrobacterium rosae]|uniref:Indoleacetamide hydrolase n=1 Tax=Agrobacterium rosae TaxID=1972867 RepID=A0A1R3U3R1_9HYPH|nr:amidase [Agrobacterium rosae]SCX31531.1 Glutamyl-tRNA(Gln) amidotransferase subunit A [Agrobacterium rosae]